MTGKDFLKIILCICGYDRNINISTYRGEDSVTIDSVEDKVTDTSSIHCNIGKHTTMDVF